MMSKKPADRFQTAGDVATQLKSWLADRGRKIGGGTIEDRDPDQGSGVGSGVFTRFALGVPTPSSGKTGSSSRTISVSDRDTKKLDEKGSGVEGPEEEIGLAPLDEEDVLGVAERRPTKKPAAGGSDKQSASTSDLATSSDVGNADATSTKPASASGSGKSKSLLEEELTDPELEHIKQQGCSTGTVQSVTTAELCAARSRPFMGDVGGDRHGGRCRSRHRAVIRYVGR